MDLEHAEDLTLGELIKAFRRRAHLTQVQFAEQLEKSRRSIIDWEAGTSRPQGKGDLLAIARVARLDEEETILLLKAGGQDPTPLVWNIPYARNAYFIGREALLSQISVELQWAQPPTTSQPIALCGLGGSGKTQIALEYAYRFYRKYQAVLWVEASSRDRWIASYVALAELLHLPERDAQEHERTVQAVKRWLLSHSHWLLLLDDIDDLTLVPTFLPSLCRGHVILTTRSRPSGRLAHCIDVETMDVESSTLLLLYRASLLPLDASLEQAVSTDASIAQTICQELGNLPLAIDQAGAYIEETQCNLARYLHLYQTHRAALLQRRGGAFLDHPESVSTTWSLSFEKIEQRSPVAASVLRLCAFLHADAIPEDLMTLGASLEETHLAPLKENPLLLDETIALLRAYSLIQRDARTKMLSIHKLVQAVLKDAMEKDTFDRWARAAVHLVNQAFPDGWFDTWSVCEQLLPHAIEVLALIEPVHIASQEAARLLNQTGGYLKERGRYREAETLALRAQEMCEHVLGPDHLLTACSLGNLAVLSLALGNYEQADVLAQQSLARLERIVNGQYEIPSDAAFFLATNLNNLASLYQERGNYAEAELLFLRSMMIWSQTFKPIHPMMAYVQNNLGTLYADQGQYDNAEALYQQALMVTEHFFGPNHPHVVTCLNNLANLSTHHSDRLGQAEAYAIRALALCEEELGPHHSLTATCLANLADINYRRAEFEQAEARWTRALSINERAFGKSHPSVARILNNLANLFENQGKYTQAEAFFTRALSIWEKTFGEQHPELLPLLLNYAILLHAMNREEEARRLETRAQHLATMLHHAPPSQPTRIDTYIPQEMLQRTHHGALDNLDRLYQLTEEALKKRLTPQERGAVDRVRELLWVLLDDMGHDRKEQHTSLSLAENIRIGQEIEGLLTLPPFVDLEERPPLKHIPGIGYVPDDFPFESAEEMRANLWWSQFSFQGFTAYVRLLVILRHFTSLSLSAKETVSVRNLREAIDEWRQDWLTGSLDLHYTGLSLATTRLFHILERDLFRKKHEEIQRLPDDEVLRHLHPDDFEQVSSFWSAMAQRFGTMKDQLIADLKTLGDSSIEQQLGPEHPDLVPLLDHLAMIHREQGNYIEAVSLFRQAVQIQEQALGTTHPDVATQLGGLANLYAEQQQYEEAEPLYQRALSIWEQTEGEVARLVRAGLLNNLAELYRQQERYEEAEPLYRQALSLLEQTATADPPHLAQTLTNLAIILSVQDRYGEAELLHLRALRVHEQSLGQTHPEVAASLANLATFYFAYGKYQMAERVAKEALLRAPQQGGPHHADTIAIQQLYDQIQQKMNKQSGPSKRGKHKKKTARSHTWKQEKPRSLQQEHDIQYRMVQKRLSQLIEQAPEEITKQMCSTILHAWEEAVAEESTSGEAFVLYGFPSQTSLQLVPENRLHEGRNPRPWTGEGSEQETERWYAIEVDQNPFELAMDEDFYAAPLPLNMALRLAFDVTRQRFFTEHEEMKQPDNPECRRIYVGMALAAQSLYSRGELRLEECPGQEKGPQG
jgi:tetratricopeptide (TPR) repeat protein/transcriptional regulator with XRE-family HTH domain